MDFEGKLGVNFYFENDYYNDRNDDNDIYEDHWTIVHTWFSDESFQESLRGTLYGKYEIH